MHFDLHHIQISKACYPLEFYSCPNRFPSRRHSMGCNCSGIVIILPIVSLYFLQRGTQRDQTNWRLNMTMYSLLPGEF